MPSPCRCGIASASLDGFGHQLEAKYSCIAAAMHLDAEYVHYGFGGKAHGENLRPLEEIVGLSGSLFPQFDRSMRLVRRRPSSGPAWPFSRPCRFCLGKGNLSRTCDKHWEPSWLRQIEANRSFRAAACCPGEAAGGGVVAGRELRRPVYVADNCFDFFHCHADWPRLWLRALPVVRSLYYAAGPKPDPRWTERLPQAESLGSPPRAFSAGQPFSEGGPFSANVVMHVRLGDAGERALPVGYYARARTALRAELGRLGQRPLFRIQTNGLPGDASLLYEALAAEGQEGPAEGRSKRPAVLPDVAVDYSRWGPSAVDDQRSSLALAFHRMVTADVLVMSRSALSVAAALISNGTILFPKCWAEFRRPLPHWRLWACCDDPNEIPGSFRHGANCRSEGRKRRWLLRSGWVAAAVNGSHPRAARKGSGKKDGRSG